MTDLANASGAHATGTTRPPWGYRLLVGALLLAILGGGLVFRRKYVARGEWIDELRKQLHLNQYAGPPIGVDVAVIDVGATFDQMEGDTTRRTIDDGRSFFSSADSTVHLHAIGRGHMCPLHIHGTTEEVTVIVQGAPEITHVYPAFGKMTTVTGVRTPGMIVGSPPFCGHQWVNPSRDAMEGNLVFTSPTFDGNLYVKPEDDRLTKGRAPFFYDPDDDLREFAKSPEPSRIHELPLMSGRMSVLMIKGEGTLDASPTGTVVGYVLRGQGTLEDSPPLALKERTLAVLRGKKPSVVVKAEPGHPLAILRFETAPKPSGAHP